MKKIYIFLLALLAASAVKAQENVSVQSFMGGISSNHSEFMGGNAFTFGTFVNFPAKFIGKYNYIHIGGSIRVFGGPGEYLGDDPDISLVSKEKPIAYQAFHMGANQVHLPLMLGWRIPVIKCVDVALEGGPYVNFCYAHYGDDVCKMTYDESSENNVRLEYHSYDQFGKDGFLDNLDYGLGANIRIMVGAPYRNVKGVCSFGAEYGLNNMVKSNPMQRPSFYERYMAGKDMPTKYHHVAFVFCLGINVDIGRVNH